MDHPSLELGDVLRTHDTVFTHCGRVEKGDAWVRSDLNERIVIVVLRTTEHDYFPLGEVGLVIADAFRVSPGGN